MKYEGKHKYHYFYRIVNNLNGHFYYGIHSTNNLDDGYMGSGTVLQRAYKKYGSENFTKTILKFFDSRKEASDYELEQVNFELTNDKKCYNTVIGGDKYVCIGKVTAFDKNENLWVLIDVDEFHKNRENYITYSQGKVLVESGDSKVYITKEEYYKNKFKYKSTHKGKILVKDKNNKYFIVDHDDERLLNGELFYTGQGVKRSEETKIKTSETFKKIKHQQGEKNSQYGTKWIHKDEQSIKIKKEFLDKYLSEGWKIGRIEKIEKPLKVAGYKTIVPEVAFKLHDEGLSWVKVGEQLGVTKGVIEKFLREFRKSKI